MQRVSLFIYFFLGVPTPSLPLTSLQHLWPVGLSKLPDKSLDTPGVDSIKPNPCPRLHNKHSRGHNESLTCIAEHFVLHYDLVAVQGLRVHFIVGVLVGEVEQDLAAVAELFTVFSN